MTTSPSTDNESGPRRVSDGRNPRRVSDGMNRSAGSFELAFSPVILALLGALIDNKVTHTSPWFTVVFAVVGLAGAVAKLYLEYTSKMTVLSEERRTNRQVAGPR